MTTLERPLPTELPPEPARRNGRDHVRVITAEDGVPGLCRSLVELWRYRELLVTMVQREMRLRYRQSTLGPAWGVLQPLLMMVVFSLFLGRFAHLPSRGIPYPIFYYAALAPWSFVTFALPVATGSMLANSALINKVHFPREIFPMVSVLVAAVDLGLASIGLAGMMLYYHTPLTAQLLYLPLLFLGEFVFCLGFGLLLAAISIHVRDIRHVLPFMTQIWMYACPVAYSLNSVPRRFLIPYLSLNPLAVYIDGFRRVILEGRAPQLPFLALALVLSALAFVLFYRLFKTLERKCADTL
jgi:lipopolysaccharide transport system permease protein